MKVQSVYNSRILKKGLKFASENGALFAATASLAFSTLRPLVILATPKTEKENRQYASTKSIASTLTGYLLMLGASLPVANAVKNIDDNPKKYLTKLTIKRLQGEAKSLKASSRYNFATQIIKLGLGFLIAAPKSIITCAIIPPIMNLLYKKNVSEVKNRNMASQNKNTSFTGMIQGGTDKLSKLLARIINSSKVQTLSDKLHNTFFEQNLIFLTDILSTATLMNQVARSKNIENDRKKALIYNSAISTGLSVAGGYMINKMTESSTERFVENFKKANKNSKNLDKYVEGIRVAKPVLILGTIYYLIIPLISTFISDKFGRTDSSKLNI